MMPVAVQFPALQIQPGIPPILPDLFCQRRDVFVHVPVRPEKHRWNQPNQQYCEKRESHGGPPSGSYVASCNCKLPSNSIPVRPVRQWYVGPNFDGTSVRSCVAIVERSRGAALPFIERVRPGVAARTTLYRCIAGRVKNMSTPMDRNGLLSGIPIGTRAVWLNDSDQRRSLASSLSRWLAQIPPIGLLFLLHKQSGSLAMLSGGGWDGAPPERGVRPFQSVTGGYSSQIMTPSQPQGNPGRSGHVNQEVQDRKL